MGQGTVDIRERPLVRAPDFVQKMAPRFFYWKSWSYTSFYYFVAGLEYCQKPFSRRLELSRHFLFTACWIFADSSLRSKPTAPIHISVRSRPSSLLRIDVAYCESLEYLILRTDNIVIGQRGCLKVPGVNDLSGMVGAVQRNLRSAAFVDISQPGLCSVDFHREAHENAVRSAINILTIQELGIGSNWNSR